MAGPRFGDIAGAGPAIDVRERRYSNGATQDIVYRAPPTASGENKLAVSVMETSYKGGGGDALKLSAPSLADIEAELGAAFPAGAMTITDDVAQNGSGVFGYAHGRVAGETCLYAWQFIAPQTRRTLLDDVAGLEGYDVSVRMRFCAHRSVSELVAMMRGTRLNLGRLGGQQGLFSSAPTMTPAVLAGPGPVVAEPLGAALPAPPPTATAGLGAQPFAAMGGAAGGATGGAAGGLDPYGAGEAVPAGYVPVLLPGQPGPVLVLRSMLAGLGGGAAASDGPRHASRPVRRAARLAVRPSTRDAGRDPDARPAAAPATLYRGLEVRTVRSAGDRAGRMAGHMAGRDAGPGRAALHPAAGPHRGRAGRGSGGGAGRRTRGGLGLARRLAHAPLKRRRSPAPAGREPSRGAVSAAPRRPPRSGPRGRTRGRR